MQNVKYLFWNASENRLRTVWRIIIFLIIVAILVNPVILLLDHFYEDLLDQTLINVIVAVGFMASLAIVARYIDKSGLQEYGIFFRKASFLRFLKGTLLGGLLISIVVLLSWAMGLITIKSTFYTSPESGAIFIILFFGQCIRFIFGSIFEELFFTGVFD